MTARTSALNVQPHTQVCPLVKHPVGFELRGLDRLLHELQAVGVTVSFLDNEIVLDGPVMQPGICDLSEQARKRKIELYAALTGYCLTCQLESRRKSKITRREAGGADYYECPRDPAHIGQRITHGEE